MMPRPLVLVGLAALSLSACETPPPSTPPAPDTTTVAPEPPADIVLEGVDDLLGDWLVTERPGAAPDDEPSTVTFMPDGEYLVLNSEGIVEQATFRPVDEGRIAIMDSVGTREFEYAREGRTLTLTTPGTESTTVLEKRDRNS